MTTDASGRPTWSMKVVWALLSLAAPLLAASAFLAFEAARGVVRDFSSEMVLATIFGLLLPLGVLAFARRRGMWVGPGVQLICLAAFVVAGLFAILAGSLGWLS